MKKSVAIGLLLLSSSANAEMVQTKYADVQATKEQYVIFSDKVDFDMIFEMVRTLLNKQPSVKINIVLCNNQFELSCHYQALTGKITNVPAFAYNNTIYLNLERLRKGIVAHELVHVLFPSKVDKNLVEHMCSFVEKEVN